MKRRSDLTPPLGKPGGPCHLIWRVEDEIRNPRLEDRLIHNIETGKGLSNSDARKVYDIETERGLGKPFLRLSLTSHAQFRMDLRGITVFQVLVALRDFFKLYKDQKSKDSHKFHEWENALYGHGLRWAHPKTKLTVVFEWNGPGIVNLITTYWKGTPDPRVSPGQCQYVNAGYTPPAGDLSGYKTFVPYTDGTKGPYTNPKDRALPSPPNTRSKPLGPTNYNVPPSSDEALDGRPLHKDRTRTLAVPGEDSPHPDPEPRTMPIRRQNLATELQERWFSADLIQKLPSTAPNEQNIDRATDRVPGKDDQPLPGFLPNQEQSVFDGGSSAKAIPWDSDLVNNKAAARIAEIQEQCSAKLREQAQSLEPKTVRTDIKNLVWLFDVPSSTGSPYRVRLKMLPKGRTMALSRMDLLVSCSCPYWRWQGPEHWAKVDGYLYGKPRGTAAKPTEKDPNGTHRACKHVLAVLNKAAKWTLLRPHRKKKGSYDAVTRVALRYLTSLGLEVQDADV